MSGVPGPPECGKRRCSISWEVKINQHPPLLYALFLPTSTGNGPGKCEKNGAGYRIRCETCWQAGRLSLYDGESGSNCYTRGKQQEDGLRLREEENPLWKHCLVEHEGRTAEFSMKQTNVFGSCLVRQVNEAVRIEMSTARGWRQWS